MSATAQWAISAKGVTFRGVGHPFRRAGTWWQVVEMAASPEGDAAMSFQLELDQSQADDPDWKPSIEQIVATALVVKRKIADGEVGIVA